MFALPPLYLSMSFQETPSEPPLKLFTLQEANALLPRIREIVARLQEIYVLFQQLAEGKSYPASLQRSNGYPRPEAASALPQLREIQALRDEAEALIKEIVEQGVALKDIEQGLIDFPAERDGRIVYLCWKHGEDEIRFWHELDTGFAGRQPL
ncbi:MAG: DUF2203 domain-containing protein [Chloroflexota bacterium]|nr:DUF2203 domain-containing protein [Chloroflexota bacterium]MDE2841259.1 DUF2203 domain-containing protein [Chloroflexota bacterium]MDE2930125.1 DUF2203 domain-containing protein [Chloroflexota bacterium]